jgi:hypothetical protein
MSSLRRAPVTLVRIAPVAGRPIWPDLRRTCPNLSRRNPGNGLSSKRADPTSTARVPLTARERAPFPRAIIRLPISRISTSQEPCQTNASPLPAPSDLTRTASAIRRPRRPDMIDRPSNDSGAIEGYSSNCSSPFYFVRRPTGLMNLSSAQKRDAHPHATGKRRGRGRRADGMFPELRRRKNSGD